MPKCPTISTAGIYVYALYLQRESTVVGLGSAHRGVPYIAVALVRGGSAGLLIQYVATAGIYTYTVYKSFITAGICTICVYGGITTAGIYARLYTVYMKLLKCYKSRADITTRERLWALVNHGDRGYISDHYAYMLFYIPEELCSFALLIDETLERVRTEDYVV